MQQKKNKKEHNMRKRNCKNTLKFDSDRKSAADQDEHERGSKDSDVLDYGSSGGRDKRAPRDGCDRDRNSKDGNTGNENSSVVAV